MIKTGVNKPGSLSVGQLNQAGKWLRFALAALTISLPVAATGYDLGDYGHKWPGAQTTFYIGMPGISDSGVPWSQAFGEAAGEWNAATRFTFDLNPQYRNPCVGHDGSEAPDFVNGVDFSRTVCGVNFSEGTLAVTAFFTEFNTLGGLDLVETDIIFNQARAYDVYDGPLRTNANGAFVFDFRRVALHELGHALGLEHEDDGQPSIMTSRIGNLDAIQDDDIAGVEFLYGGIERCMAKPAGFGWHYDALDSNDCQILELMAGGTDDSAVDIWIMDIPETLDVTLDTITSGGLDSVLLVMDEGLDIIAHDRESAGDCRPRITQAFEPGRYYVLVNTFSSDVAIACGDVKPITTGPYRLSIKYQHEDLIPLPGHVSFQGGVADEAVFYGGVTVDGGQTFVNSVRPDQVIDVRGKIDIDPDHQGQPGFVVAAVVLPEGEILVKNPAGDMVPYQPEAGVPIYQRRTLGAQESINVLDQLRPADIGVSSIEADFLIGYGVDSQPGELHFHQQPINLIVE